MCKHARVGYDDVCDAVRSLLAEGVALNQISLRMIRAALGEKGSFSTISKLFDSVKAQMGRNEPIDATELTETDMGALRTLISDIIERRTVLIRKESEAAEQAMANLTLEYEVDKANQNDVVDELEREVFGLEREIGAQNLVMKDLTGQVERLEGMVDALKAALAVFAPSSEEKVAAEINAASIHVASESGLPVNSIDHGGGQVNDVDDEVAPALPSQPIADASAGRPEQPAAVEVDRPQRGQVEMPLTTADGADKAVVSGG